MTAPLACEGITVRFGAFTALQDLTLAFPAGCVTAVIGPNGAGKTTLMNVLSGLAQPTAGRVTMAGRDVTRLPPHRRAALGLARSFQIVKLFPEDTAPANLRLALQRRRLRRPVFWRPVDSYAALAAETDAAVRRAGLEHRRGEPAGRLAHGEQRALETQLAVAAEPSVLLLDEPLAGVGQRELPAHLELLRTAAAGRTAVLVEHNMEAVMSLAQRIVVLVGGRLLAEGAPESIRRDPEVRRAYLGAEA